jgi:dihydrofolate reductase
MRQLRVVEFLSLDGVMQGPGSPEEDTEGSFAHGGWQPPYLDDVLAANAAQGIGDTSAYLFGRKTYEKMAAYWPHAPADDPIGRHLNAARKYVVSRTLDTVEWHNTSLLGGDVAAEVCRLKEAESGNLTVLGSGMLLRTLISHELVDEYFLAVFPLLLGGGKRLFPDDGQLRRFTLVSANTTSTGGVLLTYRPQRTG